MLSLRRSLGLGLVLLAGCDGPSTTSPTSAPAATEVATPVVAEVATPVAEVATPAGEVGAGDGAGGESKEQQQ